MSHRSIKRDAVTTVFLVIVVVAAAASAAAEGAPPAPETGPTCLADSLGQLHTGGGVADCQDSVASCQRACTEGDPASCLGAAYAIESEDDRSDEVAALYATGCRLGRANACTNHAAGIWVRDHTAAQAECALRIFIMGCAVNERFACGMVARVLLEGPEDPALRIRARTDLENACSELGGFPCRVLAKHLEAGDLGSFEPGRIEALLAEACKGGDPDACDAPATAAETFR